MDYCSSCRRHLNGALVCPGCGAYAPDIAPLIEGGRTVPALAAPVLWPEVAATPGTDAYGAHDDAGSIFDDADGDFEGADNDAKGPAPAPQGRAARRRQRARWKKNQRRAVVATAVALVGGGLTVASMDSGSGHRAQASTATDLSSVGTDEQPTDQTAELPPAGKGKHRKPSTTSSQPSTTGTSQHRPEPSATHTDSAGAQPYTGAAPHTTTKAAAQRTAFTPSADTTTGTSTPATQSPAPTARDREQRDLQAHRAHRAHRALRILRLRDLRALWEHPSRAPHRRRPLRRGSVCSG
ncbi:SCO2400 family protein [Streptomyces sp. NBC_00344]|uniref:SCO2400 family protein n=1 Tax=Streptomyces sp. NBC_00344 TaxID=2975720 RepID=UPI003FA6A224